MLNELPVIIDKPGMYLTRNGRQVQIREIKEGSTFRAKGTWRKGSRHRRNYDIWHESGRYMAVGEHAMDIVSHADHQ
ncbi:hypothetical protein IB276_33095 [Ensifer sp. ENS04]|uniref:hypothetical protein n=1 Tax=Ensifer sp. ENS04 TaxID=2769281 RepID=UPI00177FCAFA|nr:hypothetical protein [Ensifer sp. ENS04]MBD9544284.1 hypothetical protein [Ensifer sp. ENS04]